MIDLHCHILPGVDDGPSSIAESVEMARLACNDGIKIIVATPHVTNGQPSASQINQLVADLNAAIAENSIDITVLPGAELMAHEGPDAAANYTINKGAFVLVEFLNNFISINSPALMFGFIARGLTPIISHAERSPSVIENPSILKPLIDMGCLIQITSASVTGMFGPEIQACAIHLIKQGMAHVLATDAHSATWRPPLIEKALRECENLAGINSASSMTVGTPRLIIESVAGRHD